MEERIIRIGIDVGSTTVKTAAIDPQDNVLFGKYERHRADIKSTIVKVVNETLDVISARAEQEGFLPKLSVMVTGSGGLAVSYWLSIPFIQEVVASTAAVKKIIPQTDVVIELGGEDAKITYFKDGVDQRMNGTCAGGTGAFIDQMAALLETDAGGLNELAKGAHTIYPIAARCGVFAKTDIQPLINEGARREDIAISIFQAVVSQTISGLACGRPIRGNVAFLGGPLHFMDQLRQRFIETLKLKPEEALVPENSQLFVAYGAAVSAPLSEDGTAAVQAAGEPETCGTAEGGCTGCSGCSRPAEPEADAPEQKTRILSVAEFRESLKTLKDAEMQEVQRLEPLFRNQTELDSFRMRHAEEMAASADLDTAKGPVFLGFDAGSTTTKAVLIDPLGRILWRFYDVNAGNPVELAVRVLKDLYRRMPPGMKIIRSCSTGYGEALFQAALGVDSGEVETIAHYRAANFFVPGVDFILDIGGQDMKCLRTKDGAITSIQLNEACSSGCGSFLDNFARSLGMDIHTFSDKALLAEKPVDLGSRCTIFMNSRVKQAQKEGASVGDISAGLSYSVIKNALFKVIKLRDANSIGDKIVVQGGTFNNDAVLRAFEKISGRNVFRPDVAGLMGAYGAALIALDEWKAAGSPADARSSLATPDQLENFSVQLELRRCGKCANNCQLTINTFTTGISTEGPMEQMVAPPRRFVTGNRCERGLELDEPAEEKKRLSGIQKPERKPVPNLFAWKYSRLFRYQPLAKENAPRGEVGILRVLNMYEDYPFWHTLFTACGIRVCLSSHSNYQDYEHSACMVMSDNICFPAKLVHSHIQDLTDKRVDRIFMPFVVYERQGSEQNSYNCPIVTGYAEVIKSVQAGDIPIDSPTISFKDKSLLLKQCKAYLGKLGVPDSTVNKAFSLAVSAQDAYVYDIISYNERVCRKAREQGALAILLAGRPYHADMLIQHKVSDMLADMGIYVVTDDIVRNKRVAVSDAHYLSQWAYPNRILEAAKWSAGQKGMEFVEMTSFGCGPDAFLVDEVRDILMRHGKVLTLLKLDDINNIGSMKLRVRSLIESLKLASKAGVKPSAVSGFKTTPTFDDACRGRKILVPYFTPFISPLIPAIMKIAGYDVDNLPLSDTESCEWGLKFANNEVCYPATLIVGDIIKAFESGKYDPKNTAVAMTQTGGQCRASSYLSLIKKALVDAGYADVPVIAFSFGSAIKNEQPGFRINWLKLMPIALYSVLYSDCIAKFYYAAAAREKQPGQAAKLRDMYLQAGEKLILEGRHDDLVSYLTMAANEFNRICKDIRLPKVCVVGEIFLKFNPFAQKNVTDWLMSNGVEIVPPLLLDFFMQSFVNKRVDEEKHLSRKTVASFIYGMVYKRIMKYVARVNKAAAAFRYFTPFNDIFKEADEARKVITLSAQFGEGWLLPAEIMSCARQGVSNVVSLQPFGCIANHIVSKGIEKRIKRFFPDMNILSLDFDSGVSDVNITNRLLLFIDNLKEADKS